MNPPSHTTRDHLERRDGETVYRGGDRRADNIQLNGATKKVAVAGLSVGALASIIVAAMTAFIFDAATDTRKEVNEIGKTVAALVAQNHSADSRLASLEAFRETTITRLTSGGCDARRCDQFDKRLDDLSERVREQTRQAR